MSATHALFKYTHLTLWHPYTTTQKMTIDGDSEKVELPLFSANIPPSTLIHLTHEMFNAMETYELFDNESAARV